MRFISNERQSHPDGVFPPASLTFNAFNLCPLPQVRVLILGQDPYHNPHQAHGLSFSVPLGNPIPPSLVNIFKELKNDLGNAFSFPEHGCLEQWARQGVLLLNASLTVRANRPNSHAGKGWEKFTDAVIKAIIQRETPTVFMLWGRFAQERVAKIATKKHLHLILKAAHPSPLSASNGFFGTRHFSRANTFLTGNRCLPIAWSLASSDSPSKKSVSATFSSSAPAPDCSRDLPSCSSAKSSTIISLSSSSVKRTFSEAFTDSDDVNQIPSQEETKPESS